MSSVGASDAVGVRREARIPHLRALDGMRGLAVAAVVVFHFSPDLAPGGFLGVDIFFVLSGFLITSLLVTERGATGHVRLRAFWVRRARRLFPALILVVVAVAMYSLLRGDALEVRRLRGDGLSALFYVANWRFIWSGQSYIEQFLGTGPSPLRHTWSLAIEEQYYLVWPLLVAGVGIGITRWRTRPTGPSLRFVVVVVCLVLAVISSVLMAVLHEPGADPSRVYYGTDTRAHLLLVGSALGAATAGIITVAQTRGRQVLIVSGCASALVLGVLLVTVDAQDTWLYEGGYLAFGLLIVVMMTAAGQPGRNPLAWLLSTRPLVGLGLISYGVYLWHWPITVWMDERRTGLDGPALFTVRAVLTLAISLASYWLVEQPIRRGALRRLGKVIPRVAVISATTIAATMLLVPVWVKGDSTPALVDPTPAGDTQAATDAYESAPRCDEGSRPRQPSNETPLRVALYGNSIADEIVPCLTVVFSRSGNELLGVTQPGASLCDLEPIIEGDLRDRTRIPDVVVFFGLPVTVSPCSLEIPEDRLMADWIAGVRDIVDRWVREGLPVYLVPPIPAVGSTSETPLAQEYRDIAAEHPARIKVLDAGVFLRDSAGTYIWEMPCLPDGEPGCQPNGNVVVRLPLDGVHMCSDVTFRGRVCAPEFAGGERRAASALAQSLFALHPSEPSSLRAPIEDAG